MKKNPTNPAATPDAERAQLGIKLGKAHEDRGDYSRAFECLAQANALVRRDQPYDRGVTEAIFADIRAAFTPELFARSTEGGSNDTTPIFVLGMPRTGTTLVDRILASHSAVVSAGGLWKTPSPRAGISTPAAISASR